MRIAALVVISAFVLLEGGARLAGLGSTLVYEKTPYGYRVAPSQKVVRLGKVANYNDLGLRNSSVPNLPLENTLRILCIGDSITYGGTQTDQAETYPHHLQLLLSASHPSRKIEVLNASAGGWATENEEGWLNTHGILGAHWVVLQIATHDLFQKMAESDVVGSHPSFPNKQPTLALQEAMSRYALPLLGRWAQDPGLDIQARNVDDVRRTLDSVRRINALVKRSDAKLAVLFVEQPKGEEPVDNLTQWAKAQLFAQLSQLGVPVARPAAAFEHAGSALMFRDVMHPNARGNYILALSVVGLLTDPVPPAPLWATPGDSALNETFRQLSDTTRIKAR